MYGIYTLELHIQLCKWTYSRTSCALIHCDWREVKAIVVQEDSVLTDYCFQ